MLTSDTAAAVGQRQVVSDVAEQLQDRTKILAKAIVVQDEASSIAKRVFNSLAHSSVKGAFMVTPPLPYLMRRAHAAATQEQLGEPVAAGAAAVGGGQLRARTGGQGVAKRRGSVRNVCFVVRWKHSDTVFRWCRTRMRRSSSTASCS